MERTFIAIKPDGVQRGLMGAIVGRFEARGYKLVGMKFMQVTRELAENHYGEHKGKAFFDGLVSYITSAPLLAMVWEGPNVIAAARKMMGATNPQNAEPGTIRGDYSVEVGRNIIHGSDSPASAEREMGLFFKPEELTPWDRSTEKWILE